MVRNATIRLSAEEVDVTKLHTRPYRQDPAFHISRGGTAKHGTSPNSLHPADVTVRDIVALRGSRQSVENWCTTQSARHKYFLLFDTGLRGHA